MTILHKSMRTISNSIFLKKAQKLSSLNDPCFPVLRVKNNDLVEQCPSLMLLAHGSTSWTCRT